MHSINTDTFDRDYFFFSEDLHSVHPDAFELFRFYNVYFFQNILEASQVKWSKRMTMCAGTCAHSAIGSCTITLSEPLLQYRNANELKETLLHEMIHGYLFLTNPKCCLVQGGHGKEFQELMHTINEITQLSITVYHSFHDEVESFRKHVWKCDGPCQMQQPYFGICKRAMNRPPQKSDPWFEQHQKECGGSYHKIDGPEFHAIVGKDQAKKNKRQKEKGKGVSGELNGRSVGSNENSNSLEQWMGRSQGSKQLKDGNDDVNVMRKINSQDNNSNGFLEKITQSNNAKKRISDQKQQNVGKQRKSNEKDRTQQLLDKYMQQSSPKKEKLDNQQDVSNVVDKSNSFEALLDEFSFKSTKYKSDTRQYQEKNINNCQEYHTDSTASLGMQKIEETPRQFKDSKHFDSTKQLFKQSNEANNIQNTPDSFENQNSNEHTNQSNEGDNIVLQVKTFVAYFRDSNYNKQEYFIYLLNANMSLLTVSTWILDLFELNINGKSNTLRNVIIEEHGQCDIRISDISTCTLQQFYKNNNNNSITLHPISLLFDYNNLKISLQLQKSFNTIEQPNNLLLNNAIASPQLQQHVKM